ncbi:hypothetical protein [Limnohabitans sp. Rim8]|uniref:hypothetical protein n=1 Tax=Limnohabitans sp. Rim8 TaxID=1100718 RepID=UPI0033057CF6
MALIDRESHELEEATVGLSLLWTAHATEDTEWLIWDDDGAAWGEFDQPLFWKELHDQTQKAAHPFRAVAA